METMILDLGTAVAILAAALAIIPLPDVFIGWFHMLVPAMRSPSPPRAWATSTPRSRPRVACSAATDYALLDNILSSIERDANALEVLVKGGGWKRYSVAHLWCCGRHMRRLDRKLDAVTKKLVVLNKDTFTRLDAVLDPPPKPDEASTTLPKGEDSRSVSNNKGQPTSRHTTNGVLSAFRPHPNSHHSHNARRSPEPSTRSLLSRSGRASPVQTEDPELGRPRGDPADDDYSAFDASVDT